MYNYMSFVFIDLHASVSYIQEQSIEQNNIQKNYAGLVLKKLDNLPKHLNIHNSNYILRGIIAFKSPRHHRISSGHYIGYALRSNGNWEVIDDTKYKINQVSGNKSVNIEFLIYTV